MGMFGKSNNVAFYEAIRDFDRKRLNDVESELESKNDEIKSLEERVSIYQQRLSLAEEKLGILQEDVDKIVNKLLWIRRNCNNSFEKFFGEEAEIDFNSFLDHYRR